MGKTLVIVESPTKAKTISKFLGSQYQVESSFGHVRDLPKSKMGVDTEGGTFEPTYRISTNKTQQVKKLKAAAKNSTDIIFATDEDREGEAIAWHLAYILDIKPEQAKRIVFHEITNHAIQEALKNPRHINQPLVDAQQARRVLDRLVGYELSPFLWRKVARGLSAGRVQSVAVRLVVEREQARDAFSPQEYWSITGQFAKQATNHIFGAKLIQIGEEKLDKFDVKNETEATNILNFIKQANYSISAIEKKQAKRNPPPPFRTSTMQQQANQKFGFSSKQTMIIAQQLYEGITLDGNETVGLITYMRTDSTNLSDKFVSDAKNVIKNQYGDKYNSKEARVYAKKAKGAQEAHEAIRPTHPEKTPEKLSRVLDEAQLKLYTMIWKRAMATQMATAVLNKETVDIDGNGTDKKTYRFRATGQSIHFDGWLTLYPEYAKEEMLPELKEKDVMDCKEITPLQHFTQPPARYSDATLIKELEEHGIGRPSTYSPTISTIVQRKYVARDEAKRFFPLPSALIVTELLKEHFSDIIDYKFTALMEENLDDIAEGKKDWKPIISTFYHPFHKNLEEKMDSVNRKDVSHTRLIGEDPKTGKPVSARFGQYGPYVQLGDKEDEEKPRFASIPDKYDMVTITLEEALFLLSLPRELGELDGHSVVANIGRFGPYIQIGKEYYSIQKSDKDPYTITFEEAKNIIKIGREEKSKKTIKVFEEEEIQILNGPYGPYLKQGKKNARIPKEISNPETLTLEECKKIIKEYKPGRRGKKTTNPKKGTKIKNT